MRGYLQPAQMADYRRDGFLYPIDVFSRQQVAGLRREIEELERHHADGAGGHDLNQFFRVNGHVVIPVLSQVARTPVILDAVESILGPDLLVWSVELFIKEPGSQKVVTWHQDLTYWGMGETDEEVTAWIALSDVSVEAGCMRFIPGSHNNAIVPHKDSFADNNLLSRGQCIEDVDEADAAYCVLKPGQMSFHHGRTFHASGANRSSDRRIGMAIRYVTPEVRQADMAPDYAMLVRGCDACRGWINIALPTGLFESNELVLYDRILAAQSQVLAAGADEAVSLYKTSAG